MTRAYKIEFSDTSGNHECFMHTDGRFEGPLTDTMIDSIGNKKFRLETWVKMLE